MDDIKGQLMLQLVFVEFREWGTWVSINHSGAVWLWQSKPRQLILGGLWHVSGYDDRVNSIRLPFIIEVGEMWKECLFNYKELMDII